MKKPRKPSLASINRRKGRIFTLGVKCGCCNQPVWIPSAKIITDPETSNKHAFCGNCSTLLQLVIPR